MTKTAKVRELLTRHGQYKGWLYLPPKPWSLDTEGVFVQTDKDAPADAADLMSATLIKRGLNLTVDAAGIEDVIFNAEDQLGAPTVEQLFKALVFYIDNDAFIDFSDAW